MGLKQSKLVITTETQEHIETAVGVAKEVIENGITIASADQEANGSCPETGDAEKTTEGAEEQPEQAATDTADAKPQKKKSAMNWIQKKISFKKVKQPKKQADTATEEAPAAPCEEKPEAEQNEPCEDESVAAQKRKEDPIKWIQKKLSFVKNRPAKPTPEPTAEDETPEVEQPTEEQATPAVEVTSNETQADAVATVDQGTGQADVVSPAEPIVEIAPTTNGHSSPEDAVVEEPAAEAVATIDEAPASEVGDLTTDTNLSEKLAALGMPTEQPHQNGLNGLSNGDAAHDNDE